MPAPKKILVIGARGFTGQYVFQALQEAPDFKPVDSRGLGVDILDLKTFKNAVETTKPDGIINLAAVSTLNLENIPLIYEMNAYAIAKILDYLSKIEFSGRFINASSALVYGSNTPAPIVETAALYPEHHYAIAKSMADQCINLYFPELDSIVARPFNCIGLGHKASFVVPKIVNHFRQKAASITLGTTTVRRDFVDIRDVARMYVAVLRAEAPESIINFCSGNPTSIDNIVQTMAHITNHPIEVKFDKTFTRAVENPYMCGDNARLLALPFDYKYKLEDTLRWMLEEG